MRPLGTGTLPRDKSDMETMKKSNWASGRAGVSQSGKPLGIRGAAIPARREESEIVETV